MENTIEVTGASVEEAIKKGLDELRLYRNDVIVEIVDEGSQGLLGMGSREAHVRLTPLRPPREDHTPVVETPATPEPEPEPVIQEEEEPTPSDEVVVEEDDVPVEPEVEQVVEEDEPDTEEDGEDDDDDYPWDDDEDWDITEDDWNEEWELVSEEDAQAYEEPVVPDAPTGPQNALDEEALLGREAANNLLERMDVEANIDVRPANKDEINSPWIIDVRGDDLGALIGRHGDTLDALQYITRLIVSRDLQRRVDLIVDVDGYKARREQSLEQLAQRMAEKAKRSGRKVTLDPMPANERRVIHVTLRQDDQVETESIGSGDERRVTIIPL